jgi:hypothetical protein
MWNWQRRTVACILLAVVAVALGVDATVVAAAMLATALGMALLSGGQIVRRALEVSRVRAERRLDSARARRGLALVHTHDWLRQAQESLRSFVSSEAAAGRAAEAAEDSVEMLGGVRESLDSTRESRNQYKGGHVPVVGGNAAAISERLGGSLKPYWWTPAHLVPGRLRGATTQTSMVIDEIRVLHNAEIERSVLLLTLAARAILVSLAPLLGGWTGADTPVVQTGAIADLVWAFAAITSLATMLFGPTIVDLAMSDSDDGFDLRRRLLKVEVPLSLAVLLLQPAWTVVVFATGWTNWWQRQTPHLAFDWRKLAVFVTVVVGLQSVGLALQSTGLEAGVVEVAAALVAIAVTGGSYGAMLPLTVATAIGVVVGDSTRSIRVAREARSELLSCSKQLSVTAATIDAAAPDVPLARNAATMARQGARNLEREADLFGRRGVLARQVLADLFDQAIAQSTLVRLDSREYEDAAQVAESTGNPPPAYVVEPILGDLVLARVAHRRHAQALQRFLVAALNEASVHGTDGVRVLAHRRDGFFTVTIGNLPRTVEAGKPSEGLAILERLASKFPHGRLPRPPGLQPAKAVELPYSGDWWVAELECDVTILEFPFE